MMGVRDLNIFPLYGEQKNTGSISGPLFPTNGILALVAAVGFDIAQSGSKPTTTKHGTLAAADSKATSLMYTAVDGGAPVEGEYIQVGPAAGTFGTLQTPNPTGALFVSRITGVTGGGPYSLTVAPIPKAVPSSSVAQVCIAPFYHNIAEANTLSSLTIEKNLGGYESLQFIGCRVGKYNIKCEAANTEASFSADVQGKTVVPMTHTTNVIHTTALATPLVQGKSYTKITVLTSVTCEAGTWVTLQTGTNIQHVCISVASETTVTLHVYGFVANADYKATTTTVTNASPSPISVVNELPFIFAEAVLTTYGNVVDQVSNVSITIDNGLKATWTQNQQHSLQFLTAVTRHISGQLDLVFTSLDTPTWGYWNKMTNEVTASLTYQFQHPFTPQYGIVIKLTKINLAKYADSVKLETIIMTTLNFEADYDLAATPPNTISVVIANGDCPPIN